LYYLDILVSDLSDLGVAKGRLHSSIILKIDCYLIKLLSLGIIKKPKKYLERGMEEENTILGVQAKREAHNISNSSPNRSSGSGRLKNIA
jgi:hypothetical protein